jgi:hypothetical protein
VQFAKSVQRVEIFHDQILDPRPFFCGNRRNRDPRLRLHRSWTIARRIATVKSKYISAVTGKSQAKEDWPPCSYWFRKILSGIRSILGVPEFGPGNYTLRGLVIGSQITGAIVLINAIF